MSVKESKALIHYHKTHKHKRSIGDGTDYRAIDLVHIQTQWVRDIFNRIAYDCVSEIRKTTDQVVYPEMTALNEWEIGGVQTPHLDTYSTQEQRHNMEEETPSREWTLILHLNDDFNGGETYFPTEGHTNTPTACEGILFQGIYLEHGVNPVRRNSRHTISMWFSTNPERMLTDNRTNNLDEDHFDMRKQDSPMPT